MLSSESAQQYSTKIVESTDTDDPLGLNVVHEWFTAWDRGEFENQGGLEKAKEFVHDDYVLDMTANLKNTDMFNIYSSPEGLVSACTRLAEINFHDFQCSYSVNVNEGVGSILVEATYTPQIKATGKSGQRMTDVHVWTVKDGKVASTKIYLGQPAELDSLFIHNDPLLIVEAVQGSWLAGELDKIEVVKEMFTDDCVLDVTAVMKNTDIYTKYYGPEGCVEWVNRLKEVDFENYTPIFPDRANAAGEVLVHAFYTPTVRTTGKTGQKMEDLQKWTCRDGKVSSLKIYWGAPIELDELFESPSSNPVQIVKEFIRARDEGELDKVGVAEKYVTSDCIVDATAKMKCTDNFKEYNGPAGMVDWSNRRKEIQFGNYTLEFPESATNAGEVLVVATYVPTVKATGHTGRKMTDLQKWTVRDGKIAAVKYYWDSPKEWDKLYLPKSKRGTHSPSHFWSRRSKSSENKKTVAEEVSETTQSATGTVTDTVKGETEQATGTAKGSTDKVVRL